MSLDFSGIVAESIWSLVLVRKTSFENSRIPFSDRAILFCFLAVNAS